MDKEIILNKLGELDGYLAELNHILPKSFNEYERSVEKRRACERLLQISIETVIDINNKLVSELKLGIPSTEEDVLTKLRNTKIFSSELLEKLKKMKGLRNILVHRYGEIDDKKIFNLLNKSLKDFSLFRKAVLDFLKSKK